MRGKKTRDEGRTFRCIHFHHSNVPPSRDIHTLCTFYFSQSIMDVGAILQPDQNPGCQPLGTISMCQRLPSAISRT